MLKRKVIAFDIQNLTDARYFAAWGVEYLHFDLQNISIDQIKLIVEWVSGVQILLSPKEISWIKIKTHFQDTQCLIETNSQHGKRCFISPENPMKALNICANLDQAIQDDKSYYLLPDEIQLEKINSFPKQLGVVVKGGIEERVGLKSYEDLDLIFECLEI